MISARRGLYDALVKLNVLRNDLVGAVTADRGLARATAHLPAQLLVSQQTDRVVSHLIDVADRAEESCLIIIDYFGQTTHARGDDWEFAGHRLQCRQPKRFLLRRQQQNIRGAKIIDDAGLFADEDALVRHAQTSRTMNAIGAFAAVANHHQTRL